MGNISLGGGVVLKEKRGERGVVRQPIMDRGGRRSTPRPREKGGCPACRPEGTDSPHNNKGRSPDQPGGRRSPSISETASLFTQKKTLTKERKGTSPQKKKEGVIFQWASLQDWAKLGRKVKTSWGQ